VPASPVFEVPLAPVPASPVFEAPPAPPLAPVPAPGAPPLATPIAAAVAPPPPPPEAVAAVSAGPSDPHRIGAIALTLGMFSRRSGKTALLIISSQLEAGEAVEALVVGRFRGEDGACVVTGSRVLLANDREWKPDLLAIPIRAGLAVQGWQDDKSASLVFQHDGPAATIDQIGEREMAQRLAVVLRGKVAG